MRAHGMGTLVAAGSLVHVLKGRAVEADRAEHERLCQLPANTRQVEQIEIVEWAFLFTVAESDATTAEQGKTVGLLAVWTIQPLRFS